MYPSAPARVAPLATRHAGMTSCIQACDITRVGSGVQPAVEVAAGVVIDPDSPLPASTLTCLPSPSPQLTHVPVDRVA